MNGLRNTLLRALPATLLCLTLIAYGCSTSPTQSTARAGSAAFAAADPLPSWNDGPAKQAILDFVKTTTDQNNPKYVPPEDRIATFDQDGTTWVEQPMYIASVVCLRPGGALAPQHPEWKTKMPFKAVLTGDQAAMAKFTLKDIEVIAHGNPHRHDGGSVPPIVRDWMATAKHPRFDKPYRRWCTSRCWR